MATDKQAPRGSYSKLQEISNDIASLVETASPYVVRIVDGSRLTGTGVVWTNDGVIVTTSHGLERDEDLAFETADGVEHNAELVGRDPESDLAVLKTESSGLPFAPKADAEQARVGNLVVALGRPGTLGLQATIGLINSRIEVETDGTPEYILNTDAILYPGFSGGPLVCADGNVVGIVNRWFGRGSAVALGVPVVDHVVLSIQQHGRVHRGYLGIRTQIVTLPQTLQNELERVQESGLLIVQVEPGSPAENANILLGDTLVGIDSEPLSDVDSLRKHLRAGKEIVVETLRGGERRQVSVKIAAQN